MAECSNDKLLNGAGESNLPALPVSTLFNSYDLARYNRLVDFIVGEIFRKYVGQKGFTISDLKNPDNVSLVYRGVKDYLNNMLVDRYSDSVQDSIWKNLSDKAVIDIDRIIENFDSFIDNYSKYNNIINTSEYNLLEEAGNETEITDTPEKEDEAEDDSEEVDNKGKEYDRIGNEKSQLELASKSIKVLFRLVPKAEYNLSTEKSEVLLDNDGLPTVANFSATWSLLADRLAGEKDYDKFKEALTSKQLQLVVPEVQFINEILKIEKPDAEKTLSEVQQFLNFYQVFSKPKVPIKSSYRGADDTFSLNDEILGNTLKIQAEFNKNFVEGNIPEDWKKYTKRTESGVFFLQKDSTGNDYIPPRPETFEDKLKFLSFIGVRFSRAQFSPQELEEYRSIVDETAPILYNSLKSRLDSYSFDEKGQQIFFTINEPFKQLKKRQGSINSEIKSIERIVNFESRWSRLVPSHSSRTATGELQHLIMNDSGLSVTTYYLNNSNSIEELFRTPAFSNAKYNPQFKNSHIINFLFDTEGNKIDGRAINLELISGDKVQVDKMKSKLERGLSKAEKFLQDYNMFLQYARTDVMRTELSHSFYMLGLTLNNRPQHYFNHKGFSDSFFGSKQFKRQMLGYLNGELARIKSYDKVKEENPNLPSGYKEFSIFSEVFDGKNEDIKVELLQHKGVITDDSPLFIRFSNEYEKVLNAEVKRLTDFMNANGVAEDDLLSKQLKALGQSVDSLHRAFVAGTLVQNIEFSILYSGDPLFYKDMHKRIKGLSSTGSVAATVPILSDYFNTEESRAFDDNYSLFRALGKRRRDNSKNYQTQVLKEYPIRRGNAYLSKNLTTPSDVLIQNIIDSINLRDNTLGKYDSDYLNKILSKANEQKPADGQGYINPDFHRELSLRFGFSTPETEIAYKYEGLIFRRDVLDKQLTNNESLELQRYEDLIFAEPHRYALPVIKMVYWGNIQNTTVDAKAYDKFSVAPILPSHARNHPEMKKMLLDLVNGGYGYVKYESGTKLFKKSVVESLIGAEPDLYSTALLKEQIKTSNEQGVDTSIPTQALKLIFANLFNEGKAKTPAVEVLYNKYIQSLSDIQKEQVNRTLNDLGISYEQREGKVLITSVNVTKLSDRLIKEAKRQQLNSNIINALRVNDKGEFRMLPESTGFQKQINDLIGGILDRNLRRFKFPGGDFVLVSNANHDVLPWYKFSKDGVEPCGCRIALTKEYSKLLNKLHPDGKPIGTLQRLNALVKSKQWREENKKALTIIYGRPPIDGPHSMGHAIVYEFLSPTMGNVLILPDEITFKGGVDFDYDKEKVITPSLDENGNYFTGNPEERVEKILEKLGELQDIFPELVKLKNLEDNAEPRNYDEALEFDRSNFVNKLFGTSSRKELFLLHREANALMEEYIAITRDISSLKNNSIIETYSSVFSLPEMFAELILPTTSDNVREVSDNNATNTGTQASLPQGVRALYYLENLNVFKTFFDANGLLGAFATDNTFQQLMTYSGINVNSKYNTKKFDSWIPENINILLLSPEERVNVYKDGKILTSLRDDIEGFIKQHWNAENISATVDAAKDPFFAKLRIVWGNIGVANLLKNFGVPFERIVDFLNHPLLQYYFSLKESGMRTAEALQTVAKDRLSMKTTKTESKSVDKGKYALYLYSSEEELREKKLLANNQRVAVDEFGRRKTKKKDNLYSVEIETTVHPDYYSILDMMKDVDNGNPITKKGYEYVNKWINDNPITPERLKFLANPANDRQAVRQDANRKDENISIYSDDIRILANFLQLEKVNYAFRDFHKYFNFDTFKVATTLDVRLKEKLRRKILSQNLFSDADITKMESNSILSSFINSKAIRDIYNKMFPILGMPVVQNYLTELYEVYDSPSRFSTKNKKDLRNLPKVLSQDFTSSIIFSLGEIGGVNIFDRGKDLVIRNGKKATMVDRLIKFRKQSFYKDIASKFPVLDRFISNNLLVTDAYDLNNLKTPVIIESIQFIKNPNETLLEQEEVIEQLRDMYYSYKYDLSNKETNEKVNGALHTFLEDLFITGIIQSGFSKNYFSFQEYIPLQFKENIFMDATKKFQELSPEELKQYMNRFYYAFMNNNPRYFPWYKVKGEDNKRETITNNNKYSDRIKFYKIVLPPTKAQPDLVENTPSVPPPVPPSSTPSPEERKQLEDINISNRGNAMDAAVDDAFKAKVPVPTPKSNKDFPDAELFAKFLDAKEIYFSDIPDSLTEEQKDKAYENSEYKTRLTPENYERAKKLDKRYGDTFFDKRSIIVGVKEEYDFWLENYQYDLDQAAVEGFPTEMSDFLAKKYPTLESNDFPTKASFKRMYYYEEYPSDEFKEAFLEFISKNGWRKEFDYNPNQLKLFNEEDIDPNENKVDVELNGQNIQIECQ